MKTQLSVAGILMLSLSACSSSDDPATVEQPVEMETTPLVASHTCAEPGLVSGIYSPTSEGDCIDGPLPTAVGDLIIDSTSLLTPARNLVAGGAQYFEIRANKPFFEVYVSEPGRYYRRTLSGSNNADIFYVGYQPNLADDVTRTVQVQVVSADGEISEPVDVPLTELPVSTGDLQFSLTWSNQAYDMDLLIIHPDDDGLASSTIDKDNPIAENGATLDLSSNNDCVIDNIHDENIFFPTGTATGLAAYQIQVKNMTCGDDTVAIANYMVTARNKDGVTERFFGGHDTNNDTHNYGFLNNP